MAYTNLIKVADLTINQLILCKFLVTYQTLKPSSYLPIKVCRFPTYHTKQKGIKVHSYIFCSKHHWRNPRTRSSTTAGLETSHSQIVNTRHPNALSFLKCSLSRNLVRSSFGRQYEILDLGKPAFGHSGSECQCQKQPLTKITALYRGNTKSGTPGRSRLCIRNL